MNWSIIVDVLKMIYQLFWFFVSIFTFLFNIFWVVANLASIGIPWITLLFIIICVISKFVKLKSPSDELVKKLLEQTIKPDGCDTLYWPIANKGAVFDAPENSLAAINQCIASKCNNILLNFSITQDNEIVILHKSTLEKANINEAVNKMTSDVLKEFNISEHHPLGQHFQHEKILKLNELLTHLQATDVTIYLLASQSNSKMVEIVKEAIKKHPEFTNKIVFCCSSPIAIYKLRQAFPNLVCGLWMDKSPLSFTEKCCNSSTILISIYGAVFRNIISPVIGISLAFINKDEFNAQISTLWRNVGVRPVVYTINSPNEKRYFQQVTKTQYLTDSLRSEPQIIFKGKRK